MLEAAAKRWNGRRSLYLGSWKDRRDGAFLKYESRGVPFEKTRHPVIDGVLGRETRDVDSYPCVNLEKPPIQYAEDPLSVSRISKNISAVWRLYGARLTIDQFVSVRREETSQGTEYQIDGSIT